MVGRSPKLCVALSLAGLVPCLLAMIEALAPINKVGGTDWGGGGVPGGAPEAAWGQRCAGRHARCGAWPGVRFRLTYAGVRGTGSGMYPLAFRL